MASEAKDLIINLTAALIWFSLGYAVNSGRRKLKELALNRAARKFFGLPGKMLIIHSAIFDEPEAAWNYPATDIKAARRLARLFEALGLREGEDFKIQPDRQVNSDEILQTHNLVLLCGPIRNRIFREVAPDQHALRYTMLPGENGKNVLTDTVRKQRMQSSRELNTASDEKYDWGIVSSFANPRNTSLRIVLLAGIHGTGTVGAAEFVTELADLKKLLSRSEGGAISEVIRVNYDHDIETPTSKKLV